MLRTSRRCAQNPGFGAGVDLFLPVTLMRHGIIEVIRDGNRSATSMSFSFKTQCSGLFVSPFCQCIVCFDIVVD